MKAVILAGGLGTRLSEETIVRPKPMVEIGGKPILWHIMKIYSAYGINDFIVCLGYRGYIIIKEYFRELCDLRYEGESDAHPQGGRRTMEGDACGNGAGYADGGRIKCVLLMGARTTHFA
jgi:glucose-1-phosphate cytidylyltransferase